MSSKTNKKTLLGDCQGNEIYKRHATVPASPNDNRMDLKMRAEKKGQQEHEWHGNTTHEEVFNQAILHSAKSERQKENTETAALKTQLEEMNKRMEELQEENNKLRNELEQVKSRVGNAIVTSVFNKKEINIQTPSSTKKIEKVRKRRKKEAQQVLKGTSSQQLRHWIEEKRIRRKLSYPPDNKTPTYQEEELSLIVKSSEKRKEKLSKKKKEKTNTLEKRNNNKRSEKDKDNEKRKGTPEMQSKVIGRRERKQSMREKRNKKKRQRINQRDNKEEKAI